jgi:hypothetical protein
MRRLISKVKDIISKTPETNMVKILGCVKTYLEVFLLFGFRPEEEKLDSLAKSLVKSLGFAVYFNDDGRRDWVKYFKYKSAAFFSYWMEQVLPVRPEGVHSDEHPGVLFGGQFYNWLKKKMHLIDFRESFAATILQSKKGMPRVSSEAIKDAEQKAFDTMTSEKATMSADFIVGPNSWAREKFGANAREKQVHIGKCEMQSYIYYHVLGMFNDPEKTKFDLEKEISPYVPSLSSNYCNSVKKYGTVGVLKDMGLLDILKDCELKASISEGLFSEPVSEYYGERGMEDAEEKKALNDSIPGTNGYFREPVIELTTEEFDKNFRSIYWKAFKLATTEEKRVIPLGLAEPLKIRVITKGPPLTYFVLKPYQTFVWRTLRTMKKFTFIGETCTSDKLNEIFAVPLQEPAHIKYMSGDYSAATDELQSWVSETIADAICDGLGLSDVVRSLFTKSLTGHIYEYQGMEGEQKRGQLMGSITSFPVLCLANDALLSICRDLCVREEPGTRRHYQTAFNGDDCLASYSTPNYPIYWRALGDLMGLTESLGKTYFSDHFVTLNSVFFSIETNVENDYKKEFKEIKYINLGLLHGNKRSAIVVEGGKKKRKGSSVGMQENVEEGECEEEEGKGLSEKKMITELGSDHVELLDRCPETCLSTVRKYFLYIHGTRLREQKTSWFLPTYLGGLGLKPIQYTFMESCLARTLKISGLVEKIKPIPTRKEWRTYDLSTGYKDNVLGAFASKRHYMKLKNELPESYLILRELANCENLKQLKCLSRSFETTCQNWLRNVSRIHQRARAALILKRDSNIEFEQKCSVSGITRKPKGSPENELED